MPDSSLISLHWPYLQTYKRDVMIRLKERLRHNGQAYELIKRSDKVAIFSINGGGRYEVSRIYILPQETIRQSDYEEREAISSDRQFMNDGSRYCKTMEDAIAYFKELNSKVGGKPEETFSANFLEKGRDLITPESIEAKKSHSDSSLIKSNEYVIPLPATFMRKGILYKELARHDTAMLYALYCGDKLLGYEVCRVRILPEQVKFGRKYPVRESLPSDEEFGNEGSKSFFSNEYERATTYYEGTIKF